MAPKTKDSRSNTVGRDNPAGSGIIGAEPRHAALGTPDELITPEMKKYQATLGANPSSRVFATLAELYRKQGMYDEAIGLCLKGLKHHPEYLSGRVVLGLAYFDKGMLRDAAEELERVISAKPNHLMAARALGDVMLADGDTRRAEFYFNHVLSLAPDDRDIAMKLESLAVRDAEVIHPVPAPIDGPGDNGPAGDDGPVPDEIIEGDGLEIVDGGQSAQGDSAGTPPPAAAGEAPGPGGTGVSDAETADTIIRIERRNRQAKTPPTRAPGAGAAAESDAAPDAAGLLPLYRAIERLQIGVVITDLDGTVHYANRAASESHGWAKDDPIGRNIGDFFPPGVFQPMAMHEILDKKSLAKDTVNVRKDGSTFPVRITYDVVEGDSKEPAYIIVGIDDLSRQIDTDEDLWQYSIKDPETGLFNHRYFLTKITEEAKRAERIGYPLCLMVITINNLQSYPEGEAPRKGQPPAAEIGKIIRQSIRKEFDSAYRLTEEEFAVILLTATDEKAQIVAKRLREKLAKRLPGIEVAIGTAQHEDRRSIEDLIKAAEKAIGR